MSSAYKPRREVKPDKLRASAWDALGPGRWRSTALFPHDFGHAGAGKLPVPRKRSPLAPTRIDAFERPVADHAGEPVTILLARQDEAADRQLAALMVAVEQVDGQDLTR